MVLIAVISHLGLGAVGTGDEVRATHAYHLVVSDQSALMAFSSIF